MLLPKKTKYRKQQRGRRAGTSKGQTRVLAVVLLPRVAEQVAIPEPEK